MSVPSASRSVGGEPPMLLTSMLDVMVVGLTATPPSAERPSMRLSRTPRAHHDAAVATIGPVDAWRVYGEAPRARLIGGERARGAAGFRDRGDRAVALAAARVRPVQVVAVARHAHGLQLSRG